MKRFILAAMAALSISAITAPAWAVNEYLPTWYVGVRGSINMMHGSDLRITNTPETENDFGFAAGASAGFYMPRAFIAPLDSMRFEAEISRYWHVIDNGNNPLRNPLFTDSDLAQDATITSYMVNGYYYLPFNTMFQPYIGGGIGRADIELDGDAGLSGSNNEDVNAWQFMVGLAFENHPDSLTEWNLGYRYFETDQPEFQTSAGDQFKIDTVIHSVELGLRFRF